MSKQEQIKEISKALNLIKARYAHLLSGITPQAVILSKINSALQGNDFDDCAGLVVDLWESCEKASQEKRA